MGWVTPSNVAPFDTLSASRWNQDVVANAAELAPFFGPWSTSHTPALTAVTTNPTLGSGSSALSVYLKVGLLVIYRFSITFGTSGVNAGSGVYRVSVPFNRNTSAGLSLIGSVIGSDVSTGARNTGTPRWATANTFEIIYTGTGFPAYTNAAPWTWEASDVIAGGIVYQAAA